MNNNYFPSNDARYAAWLAIFNSVAGTNATTLGLSPSDLTALNASLTNFNAAVSNATATRNAAKAAMLSKQTNRKNSSALVRGYARRIQANPNVSVAIKQQLGLPIHKTPSGAVVPTVPAALVATPHAAGFNALKWKPNGNTQGTVYVVEVSLSGSTQWTQVGAVTKTRFDHQGVTPGQTLYYRVSAQRGKETSAPSNDAVVYRKQSTATAAKAVAQETAPAETVTTTPMLLLPSVKTA